MGMFSRMKTAFRSKGNAAVDKASDPGKELDRAIRELEETHQAAMKELLDYKTSAKRMEQDLSRLADEIALWDQRARAAVKKGEDELAKKCLREKKRREDERASIERDQKEAQAYAAELNKSRKQAEARLKMLKMRKGTLATQIASARSGQSTVLAGEDELFERLGKAEERIDEGAVAAEIDATMATDDLDAKTAGDDAGAVEGAAELGASSGEAQTDAALADLKAKMKSKDRGGPAGS